VSFVIIYINLNRQDDIIFTNCDDLMRVLGVEYVYIPNRQLVIQGRIGICISPVSITCRNWFVRQTL